MKYLALTSLILISNNIFAQESIKITGVVIDAQTEEPLAAANVWLEEIFLGAATDADGYYRILNIPAGSYEIRANYIGYENFSDSITVRPGDKINKVIKMVFAGAGESETIIVTAQAKGQIAAINEQLISKSIKNVVSAERIQELPDANAAETLGRLPGVSVNRVGGEGNKVVVRGLSPKYNKITIEGVTMAASDLHDRSTDISMISPYSLDGIEVIKSATADHDADFVGGAVNFKLRKADPGLKYDLVSQGGYNGLKTTYSDFLLTGAISNRFLDERLGVFLQGNIERRNRSSNELSAAYNVRTNAIVGEDNPVFTQNFTLGDIERERSRLGATVVLDYSIPEGNIFLKNFLSNSGTDIDRYSQRYMLNDRSHRYIGRREEYDLISYSNILGYDHTLGPIQIESKLSHAYSQSDVPKDVAFTFLQSNALSTEVTNEAIPPYEVVKEKYSSAIDDSASLFRFIDDGTMKTEERKIETELNLKYDFTLSRLINGNVKIGGKYRFTDRSHNRTIFGSNLYLGREFSSVMLNKFPWMKDRLEALYGTTIGDDYDELLPYLLFNDTRFDHKDFLDGEYSMGAVPDLDLLEKALASLKNAGLKENHEAYAIFNRSSNKHDYSGNEYYSAAYAMTELNFTNIVKFIPGLRYEKNKTEYTAVRGIANTLEPERLAYEPYSGTSLDSTTIRINEYFLPMIHLKIQPVDWFDIRLAYTQTLARPNYSQITPGLDKWSTIIDWNDYNLKPEFSENWDLYLSFQENYVGLFTIGGFTKNIDDMIFFLGKRIVTDPDEYDFPDDYKHSEIYTYANNQHKAKVWGIELDWQTNFWYLPGYLKGLVLNINYTHIFSEAKYPITEVINEAVFPWDPPIWVNVDSSYTSRLIDQPDDIINVQIGYDYKGFSTRVSMLYQTGIFKRADFWPELSNLSDDYLRFDFSAKQNLPWYNLQLFANVNNITGARERNLVRGAKWDSRIQEYGMTVDLGLRIRL